MKKSSNFGEAFAELEAIVAWFESGDVDLDEALKKFERGLALAAECRKRLADVDVKIIELKKTFGP